MYPASFDYHRASSLDEAINLLKANKEAKVLAGGHSLVPAMKYRVANPAALVDIARAVGHDITVGADGNVTLGAMATHASVARSVAVQGACAMLAQAAGGIGDPMVRNRGTLGGSIAHADPQADYPIVLRTLGATLKVKGPGGAKSFSSETFFKDLFTTQLGDGEIITEVVVNGYSAGTRAYYYKIPHPASGYAVVGAGALVTVDGGKVTRASICIGGVTATPTRCTHAEEGLKGVAATAQNIDRAAALVAKNITNPIGDHYASETYRIHLASVAVKRALMQACGL